MKAVIVAAGRSSRLYPLTLDTPKGLLEVGGETLLGRSIRLLRENGILEIAIVVGFQHRKIRAAFSEQGISCIYNPFYAETNNLGSLWLAKDFVGSSPFLYLHSDIVYHADLLKKMVASGHSSMLVDPGATDEEAMKVAVAGNRLVESNKQIRPENAHGEWIGICSFSETILPSLFSTLEEVLEERLFQAYDTEAFSRMAQRGEEFRIISTDKLPWVEIDFQEDLEKSRRLFPS